MLAALLACAVQAPSAPKTTAPAAVRARSPHADSAPVRSRPQSEAPVGFIWHYPFVDVGTPEIPRSGANVMASRANWGALEPEPGRFDFSGIDRQLAAARAGGYRLMLILECNAFCSPKWVVDRAGAAGELCRDSAGSATGQGPQGGVPRAQSRVFLDLQNAFLHACIGHIRQADPQHTISHYFPGIEWWFPPSWRYAPADVARFRDWLHRRYRTLGALNAEWGSAYGDWNAIGAPELDDRRLFEKGRGGLIPFAHANRQTPGALADWEAFWSDTAAEVIGDLAARVKRLDPTRRTVSFLTLSFANSAEWDYVRWASAPIDKVARAGKSLDALGMQLVACDGDAYRIAAGLDTARKYGRPPMVLDLLDFARGVAIGPRAMRRATLTAVQHGAAGLIYCCWNGAKDFHFHPDWPMDELHGMLAEGRQALKLVEGMHVVPEAALVMPRVPAVEGAGLPEQNDPLSAIGWYKLLESLHVPVDVLTPDDLGRGAPSASKYRWVLVPDCAWLQERAAASLAAYADAGGTLVAGGRLPEVTPSGHAVAAQASWAAQMPDYGREYAGDLIRDNSAGDTPPMFVWGTDSPRRAQVREKASSAIRGALEAAGIAPHVDLRGSGSERISATVLAGRGRRAIFLVNQGAAAATGLSLRVSAAPARVLVDLAPADTHTVRRDRALWLDLPPFERICIVWLR